MNPLPPSTLLRSAALALVVVLTTLPVADGSPPVAAASYALNVTIYGAGTVSSVVFRYGERVGRPGPACQSPEATPTGQRGERCTETFEALTTVELSATPAPGYSFRGFVEGIADPQPAPCDYYHLETTG